MMKPDSFLRRRLKNLLTAWSALPILLMLAGSDAIVAQNIKKGEPGSQQGQGSLHNTRGYSRFSKGAKTVQEGHSQYRQIAMHDGNLVTGPVTNSGVISQGESGNNYGLRIGWPKGAERSDYIWRAFFYVAAEVVNHNGDTLHIVSDNTVQEISPDGTHEYATMPLPGYYNMDIPGSLSTPIVKGISEDLGIDGLPDTGDFGEGDGILQPAEDFNGNGALDVSMQNQVAWFAMSHRRETWPTDWPIGSFPGDDGVRPSKRASRWNGEYGAYARADQESYYVMDDRENDEFEYYPFDDPRPWPEGRRGLGIEIEARAYQWNARLAEDIMICIYDIALLDSAKELPTCIVGMYIDPDLGGEYAFDDADFDSLDDITYAWNRTFTSNQGLPLGYFGFAFLESPGLASDGVDNDNDGMIDESQYDGIDNDGDWRPWEDLNGNGIYDNEDLNYNGILDPGEDLNENGRLDWEPLNDDLGEDGLGPEFFEYPGPDDGEADGIPTDGEPNFDRTDNDESDQVGLTSFYLRYTGDPNGYGALNDEYYWNTEIPPGTHIIVPGYQNDISVSYGSGYIPLAGVDRRQRYAIALVFGNDYEDIFRNKRTMQVIYDNDYNFAKPPRQPILIANGDHLRVFLEWDSGAERSRDPIYGADFEAYYVYRSTDPTFNEIKTITDAFGNPFLFKPMAIFDLNNGLKGLHPISIGSEIGPGSDLGVKYNMGTDGGLQHHFVDTTVINGRTYYYAVAALDQGYHPDFFDLGISTKQGLSSISPTESPVNIQLDLLGRPIAFDPNTAAVIPTERSGGWVDPQVSEAGFEHVSGIGTGSIEIQFYNPLTVKTNHRYRVEFGDNGQYEFLDPLVYTGKVNHMVLTSLTEGVILGNYENPRNNDFNEQYIVEGLRLLLHNDSTRIDVAASSWTKGNSPLALIDLTESQFQRVGRDYEIRVMEMNADTSLNNRRSNFQIWDVTDADNTFQLDFFYIDQSTPGILDHNDEITISKRKTPPPPSSLYKTRFSFPANVDSSARIPPQPGDVFKIVTRKTFDRHDAIEFTVVGNDFNNTKAANELDNIYVVPDPYIAVNPLERKVYNEAEGRGDRRIDFVNLPRECSITIFTVSGRLVQRIQHSATEANRRASWDLRTKDGLEIAHGMYFYVVEAPGVGKKTGKFAVIK